MKCSSVNLVVLAVLAGLAAGCHREPSRAVSAATPEAQRPDPCVAALAPSVETTDRDKAIGRAQTAARGARQAKEALERLGYLYVGRARAVNDPGDYALAGATADCLETRYPGEASTLLLRGHVLHQRHRFKEAEEVARQLVARRTMVLDYGLLGDVLMEQGRLADAAAAYQKMIDLKPFYQSYARAAHLRWLKGDLDGAIAALRLAIQSASPRDPESSAWAWARMSAYHLQAGKAAEAARAAATALEHQPDYAAALLAQGRAQLALKQTSSAVETLRSAARLNPLPEYQWVFADALRVHGLEQDAQRVEGDLVDRGSAADPRTLAVYLATRRLDPEKAIALAEEELKVRTDVFTLDAYAWALAAAGRHAEARAAIQRATAEGTEDARLFLHAGVIHLASGHRAEARRWLTRARRLQATLLPSEAAELARSLTQAL
jgi:tetratricopeptide (TPR) repeat protein